MTTIPSRMQRTILARRPSTHYGPIEDGVLRFEEDAPVPALSDNEVLVRVEWISVDPTGRGWMNDNKGSYIQPVPVGATMRAIAAGTVQDSRHPDFKPGDRVSGMLGWQEYAAVHGDKLDRVSDGVQLDEALNVLGIAGQTAWVGLHNFGRPKKGDTVVVTTAAGSVGSVAVQLAVAEGTRVIGVAGSDDKCGWVRELGAEDCVNYKTQDLGKEIARLCPNGINVLFDNVGGPMLDTLLMHLAPFARVVMCGVISRYEDGQGPVPLKNYMELLFKRASISAFNLFDHVDQYAEMEADLLPRVRSGELQARTDVLHGLDSASAAFQKLFTGSNIGKLLVKVTDD